jgi:hypothetical protein
MQSGHHRLRTQICRAGMGHHRVEPDAVKGVGQRGSCCFYGVPKPHATKLVRSRVKQVSELVA